MRDSIHDPTPYPAAPTDAAAAAWEVALVGLLGRLEHLRAGMAGRRLGADGLALLDAAEGMVHAAEELAESTPTSTDSVVGAATDAVSKGGTFFTAAHALRGPAPRGGGGFLGAVRAAFARPPAPPADAVRDALAAAADALQAYFAFFTDQFGSSAAARGCVDAASAFLADFRRQVRDTPA